MTKELVFLCSDTRILSRIENRGIELSLAAPSTLGAGHFTRHCTIRCVEGVMLGMLGRMRRLTLTAMLNSTHWWSKKGMMQYLRKGMVCNHLYLHCIAFGVDIYVCMCVCVCMCVYCWCEFVCIMDMLDGDEKLFYSVSTSYNCVHQFQPRLQDIWSISDLIILWILSYMSYTILQFYNFTILHRISIIYNIAR